MDGSECPGAKDHREIDQGFGPNVGPAIRFGSTVAGAVGELFGGKI